MIRVAAVDDQEIIRAGLRTIIDAHPALTVVAECADGLAALRLIEQVDVDLLLLDLRMPGIDGVEVIRRLRRAGGPADLRILVLTTFDQDENVLNALKAGADGFHVSNESSAHAGKEPPPEPLLPGFRRVGAASASSPNASMAAPVRTACAPCHRSRTLTQSTGGAWTFQVS